jgi:hypothetical protein
MTHKPGRLIGNIKTPGKLVGADSFLTRSHEVKGQQPFMQLDMGIFKQSAHGHGEMLAAAITLVKAGTVALALKFGNLLRFAALRANGLAFPAKYLKVLSGKVFVKENGVGEVCAHGS